MRSGPINISYEHLEDFLQHNYNRDVESRRYICALGRLDVTRHIEAKHVILLELYCQHCNKPSKNKNALRMHIKNCHSDQL